MTKKKIPPYVVTGTPVMSKKFREEYESQITDEELREFIIRQNRGAQNIAPGSPLYDRVMGTNTVGIPGDKKVREAQQKMNEETRGILDQIGRFDSGSARPMKTSTQVKLAFCMIGFSIGVFCVLITLAVTQ